MERGTLGTKEREAILAHYFQCAEDCASDLNAKMSLRELQHRDILTHQGDDNTHVWIVIDGSAHLRIIDFEGQVKLLTTHGPGEIFGAYPAKKSAPADVIAQSKLIVLQIQTSDLQQLLESEAALGAGLSKILGEQFNAIMGRMAARITLTASGRVYDEILRLAGDKDIISPPPIIAAVAMTVQTTRETASRAINMLERRGIIKRDANELKILSRRTIEDLVI